MGSVKLLMEKEGGGAAWLQGLRQVPYLEASEALCSLPGVGPKVTILPWPSLYLLGRHPTGTDCTGQLSQDPLGLENT